MIWLVLIVFFGIWWVRLTWQLMMLTLELIGEIIRLTLQVVLLFHHLMLWLFSKMSPFALLASIVLALPWVINAFER